MRNPYSILGVSSLDSIESIKNKYKKLSKLYHPDNLTTGNLDKFREIKSAWEYINKYHKNASADNGLWRHKTLFKLYKEV